MFPCVLWWVYSLGLQLRVEILNHFLHRRGSRLSIAASILRLCPPGSIWRRITFFTSILFGFMWAGLVIMRSYFCGRDSSWHSNPGVQCFLPRSVGTFTLVSEYLVSR